MRSTGTNDGKSEDTPIKQRHLGLIARPLMWQGAHLQKIGKAPRTRLNADPSLAPNLSTDDPEYRGVDDPDAHAHVTACLRAQGYGSWRECQP